MKRLLAAAILQSSVLTVIAQGGPRVSIEAGANYTLLRNKNRMADTSFTMLPSFGFTGGVSAGWNMLGYNYGFTLGALFKQYNQKYDGDGFDAETRLTYIELPFLFRLRPVGNKITRMITYGGPYFEAGIQPGFLSSARSVFTDSTGNVTMDSKSSFEPVQLSGVVGFGFHQIGLDNWAMTHGLRFTYGFQDITGAAGGKDKPYGNKAYEPTNTISAGYLLVISYKWPMTR